MQALWSGYFTIDWGKSGAEASSKVDRLKYHFVCGCGKPGCQACINRPEPLGCELNCMLCQFDPKVAIPYLTGQRKQLQEVLKPLWDRIDLFLEWGCAENCVEDLEIRSLARELEMLLRLCPFTRFYLDSECCEGWTRLLIRQLQQLLPHGKQIFYPYVGQNDLVCAGT